MTSKNALNLNLILQPKPKICFVAHSAYGAMCGGSSGDIGGIQHQQSLMARWLASRGYRVRMLTWDEGQPDGVEIDGVQVLKMCPRDAGLRGPRFVHPRWTSLCRAMRRAEADLYYHNCGEYVTGQVAFWCRSAGRKFVYSVANDPDVDPQLPEMKTIRERVLYRYGLRHADRVIVQTRTQQAMLRDGFGRESAVIPMPCPGPHEAEYMPPRAPAPNKCRVLWVARVSRQKRPDRLLDLAEACPDLEFDFVGPSDDSVYVRGVMERAKAISNINVCGPVSRSAIHGFYERAACLCCTSDFEGFPNTFLEAWSHGLPVVSTFDPDNLIAERNLGVVAKDVPGLANGIRALLESPQRWRQASENGRHYYLENHTVDSVMSRFERVFLDVLKQNTALDG